MRSGAEPAKPAADGRCPLRMPRASARRLDRAAGPARGGLNACQRSRARPRSAPGAATAPATPAPAAAQLTGDDLGPPPAPALVQLGGYRIVGKLGEGGMGVVYQALQLSLDRTVALKVIKGAFTSDRPFVARFLREARVAARIDHANVVAIYDTGEADGHLFTAQQFVPGGDLQQRLATGGACSEDEALRIAAECGRGLRAIHLAGLVHRDIKPSNIFIAADGSVKIGDLGLVRSVLDDERLTYSGDLIGTPAYMSPEQALAESDVDARTDLYALGASLYHLLTGLPPFGGKSPFLIGHQVLAEMAPDPRAHNPALSPETCAIIHHAMRKERSLRYQTADEMVEDLSRARARTPLRYARVAEMAAERRATLGAAFAQGGGSPRRRLGPALLALAVVLSVACALAIGLRLASGPQPLPPPVLPAEEGFPAPAAPPAPESVAALPELILDHDGPTRAAGEELARREAAAAADPAQVRSRPQLLPQAAAPAAPASPVRHRPLRPAASAAAAPAAQPAGVPDGGGHRRAGCARGGGGAAAPCRPARRRAGGRCGGAPGAAGRGAGRCGGAAAGRCGGAAAGRGPGGPGRSGARAGGISYGHGARAQWGSRLGHAQRQRPLRPLGRTRCPGDQAALPPLPGGQLPGRQPG